MRSSQTAMDHSDLNNTQIQSNLNLNSKDLPFFHPQNGILSRLSLDEKSKLIGEIVTIMLASPLHCKYVINDIGSVFFPPLHLNQFRIYRIDKKPVGIITWAKMSKDVEQAYINKTRFLKPDDWNSGDRNWVTDFIAPFGHANEIIKDLKFNVFPNEKAKSMRVDSNFKVRGIRTLHGANFLNRKEK